MKMMRVIILIISSVAFFVKADELLKTPKYDVLPCCQLCPEAADSNNYNNSFLQANYRILEGKNGWLFRSQADLKTDFGPKPDVYPMLFTFLSKLERRGSKVLLVYTPSRGLVHSDELISNEYDKGLAQKNYIKALSMFRSIGFIVPQLDRIFDSKSGKEFFFHRDSHWTPDGSRLTAELVAEEIKKDPLYTQLKSKKFSTTLNGFNSQPGVIQLATSQLCHGDKFTYEFFQQYITQPVDDDADSLIADNVDQPDIVLLGTSFSAMEKFNFDGFLKQYLGKDLLNLALSGGEDRGAWTEYLVSDTYQKKPPKLIIWEVPSQHSMSDKSLFRQLIPLVDNGCHNKTLLLNKSQTIDYGKSADVVFSRDLLDVNANELVVDLTVSDPDVKNLQVRVWYQDGTNEIFTIKQNKRAQSQGRFVFLLSQDDKRLNSKFLSMDITQIDSHAESIKLDTSVCSQSEYSK